MITYPKLSYILVTRNELAETMGKMAIPISQ